MNHDERRLTEIIGGLIDDIRLLIRDQIALAQAELRRSVQAGVTALMLMFAAGLLLSIAGLFALLAAVEGIVAAGLPRWAGYLIVAGAIMLLGGVFLGVAARRARTIGLARTKASVEQTRAAVIDVIPSRAPDSPAGATTASAPTAQN